MGRISGAHVFGENLSGLRLSVSELPFCYGEIKNRFTAKLIGRRFVGLLLDSAI